MREKISGNLNDDWMLFRLINKGLATYRELFIECDLDFDDLLRMHQYCDRMDYDEAISNYKASKK